MSRKELKIGLFGLGCVGGGLYDVLNRTQGIKARIEKICVKDKNKKRAVDAELITYDKWDILSDENINVVVELIDDADAAFEITKLALERGKAVVTANKKMIAEHFEELYSLQVRYGRPVLYEGSVCASIPIIRNLEEYYDNDLLTSVEGIFNGSTNYILTRMNEEGLDFAEALAAAQEAGFAESDPSLDVEGFDPKFKLAIILNHAFGIFTDPEKIFNYGIGNISAFDREYAKQKGLKIKLVASCRKSGDSIHASVLPRFVDTSSKLYDIEREFNGVVTKGVFAEDQFFAGKGAGAYPTASAVLSDISALTYDYRYEYKKYNHNLQYRLSDEVETEIYVRFDTPGLVDLSAFTSIKEWLRNEDTNYVIGTINFAALREAAWLRSPGVSVISTGNYASLPQHVERIIKEYEPEYA